MAFESLYWLIYGQLSTKFMEEWVVAKSYLAIAEAQGLGLHLLQVVPDVATKLLLRVDAALLELSEIIAGSEQSFAIDW